MTCPKCNAPIDESMKSCVKCGAAATHTHEILKSVHIIFRIGGKVFPWGCASVFLVWLLLGILLNLIPEPPASIFSRVLEKGHDLQRSILQANTIRASLGLPAVWPKTEMSNASPVNDISSKAFKTSTEYFKALFDEENFGTEKWKPYLINFEYSKLAGAGVQACTNHCLMAENNIWVIAANLTPEDDSRVPVLITRNVDVKEIERVVNRGLKKHEFKNGISFSATHKIPFSNKCLFVVLKSGRARCLGSRKTTLGELFNNKELPPRDPTKPPIVYLMP